MSSNNSMSKSVGAIRMYSAFGLIIILIIIGFIYMTYTNYSDYKLNSPYLINGIADGTVSKVIESYKLPEPNDGKYGQEFTYTCWLYIKDTNFLNVSTTIQCDPKAGTGPMMRVIMNKGSNDLYKYTTGSGANAKEAWHYPLLSSPGVFLYPTTNQLHIRFNTFDSIYKSVDVGNIPLNKWFMLTVVLIGNSVDIYINNLLKKRENIGVVKLNYGNLNISPFGGFDGFTYNLRYFNRAVESWEIDQSYQSGLSQLSNAQVPLTNIQQSANLSNSYFFTTGYPNGSLIANDIPSNSA